MNLYAEVVLSVPLDRTFTYSLPSGMAATARAGSRVLVPFGQRKLTAIVVALLETVPDRDYKLRDILEILDDRPIFTPRFLEFTRELSLRSQTPWGELLLAALPPSLALRSRREFRLSEAGRAVLREGSVPADEAAVLRALEKRPLTRSYLERSVVRGNPSLLSRLESAGSIESVREIRRKSRRRTVAASGSPRQLEMDFSLDTSSLNVLRTVSSTIGRGRFSPHYLFGPRSRREGIILHLVRETVSRGKKALVLVPDISLTQGLIESYESKIGERLLVLHSRLSEAKREDAWRSILGGAADVVVGTRSTVFSPLEDLGLIVVDEEQDESYFQQESPVYDARRAAWLRAAGEGAVLVFGSDAPSVEEFHRAGQNGYLREIDGEEDRFSVEIFDDRGRKGGVAPGIQAAIGRCLQSGNQALIFASRRGYASYLLCLRCGYIPRCPSCHIAFTLHLKTRAMACHYCGKSRPEMTRCEACGSGMIEKRGMGIEGLEEELTRSFPGRRISSFDSDAVRTPRQRESLLDGFRRGDIDVLLGTGMLARRVDLPAVSLVIVHRPETILALSDFRAGQKAYDLLSRARNRVLGDGRSVLAIQTSLPDHHAVQAAVSGRYRDFFRPENEYRRLLNYPPHSCLAEVLLAGDNLRSLARASRNFSQRLGKNPDIEMLGPSRAPLARIKGRHRLQLILKSPRREELQKALSEILPSIRVRRKVIAYE